MEQSPNLLPVRAPGIGQCFFGGTYAAFFAAAEAFKTSGGDQVQGPKNWWVLKTLCVDLIDIWSGFSDFLANETLKFAMLLDKMLLEFMQVLRKSRSTSPNGISNDSNP